MNKLSGFLLFCFISLKCSAQVDTLVVNGCDKTFIKSISLDRIKKVIIDTCFNMSVTMEYKKVNESLVEGNYTTYWDAEFKTRKMAGYLYLNHPVGVWQEYYQNGNLLSEGSCDAFDIRLSSSPDGVQPVSFIIVKYTSRLDTNYIPYTRRSYDSIDNLTTYSHIHTLDTLPGTYRSKAISGFPGVISIKVGEWMYYDEKGALKKREYYKNGTLIKTEYH